MKINTLSVGYATYIVLCLLFLTSLGAGNAIGQTVGTEEVLRRVAEKLISNTSFKFVNPKTGQKYESTRGLTSATDIVADSKYNHWEYVNGVITIGMLQTAATLNDKKYSDYSLRNFDLIFSNAPFFEQQFKAKVPKSEFIEFFRMSSLDDVGAMAAGLTDVNALVHNKDYEAYLDKAARYITGGQSRLPDGTLCRPGAIWADDLYMSVPFLARIGKLTSNEKYFDDAIKQVENFNRYLFDTGTGLYFHTYYTDENINGVAHWGRCNGWIAMATVELLNNLPQNHPKRKELTAFLVRQIAGYSRYQDQSGLWHQLIDKPDSYLETSVTAMFTYAIARAVNQGWIGAKYMPIAHAGWKALAAKITADGQMQDVCIGTGIETDLKFYYTRPTPLNDSHGIGAFLLAGCEMLKAEKNNTVK
ncbi:MAG: glycoside hydrolase family 88/105 protein [Mucilaginibacter sp.]